ncbi:hypothetical protein BCR36DRAFT_580871 [Piromyces finnis]|uniref:Transmembrane protein n=1 Tax=Piromyces finnis TaxID=1754191 RepID=A0A1Y1VHP8_9FUNG|nr:hypothetical protein BCR36DRAFT_580871 [Piromyces finnis]|eukprot:ORX56559.1 hypothetical protein BCR36DRAFT_580871 [Piromyces finnis]
MKFYTLFFLVVASIAFIKADKCDKSNFEECIRSIQGVVGIGAKTAESQCPLDICKNVRNDYEDCMKESWKGNKNYSNDISKILSTTLQMGELMKSLICAKDGGVYCYDELLKVKISNGTLIENCSKCQKHYEKNLKELYYSTLDKNDEKYDEKKKQLDELSNICSGALSNASLKIASILLIGLISTIFLF